jgi:DNA helicase HerA-like ATPase
VETVNSHEIYNSSIGTVEFVSPDAIKVLLDIEAPQSTSINTGIPQAFPRINGFLLIPNEGGAIIGLITWIGIEYSPYPKRKGYKDFDLVDLPFPLRKLSLSPVGVLKEKGNGYEVERGIYSYPSVGDLVIVPNQEQLKAIVENKEAEAKIRIGVSPLAANAPIYVNPDKLFGRHLAVLGNTGSGKSCTVAGLIRWSIEGATEEIKPEKKKEGEEKSQEEKKVNARFIILDPNGEYSEAFSDLANVRRYAVKLKEDGQSIEQLKVPAWMWNSWEWASISQASEKTQRPLLRRALREIKSGLSFERETKSLQFKWFLTDSKIILLNFQREGPKLSVFPGMQNYGEFLEMIKKSLETFNETELNDKEKQIKNDFIGEIENILNDRPKNSKGYFPAFSLKEVIPLLEVLRVAEDYFGPLEPYEGPDEDSPIFFKNEQFLKHLQEITKEQNAQQYLDFFIMRVRSLFTDKRIASVIRTESAEEKTLLQWLNDYIGSDERQPSITIVDLSLLPSEILYLIVSVMARLIFEAHHRYKKLNGDVLPTVMVVDEAHDLIRQYKIADDSISSQQLCTQIFEKIAKEGRKFGLGLVVASQRPSELSQTVLSQCNTFLLHRIVSDRDQEMVKRLVPDSLSGILNELPVLPSRKAILLGWAAPIPVLVEINELKKEQRPESKDPDFWEVWTGKAERERKADWREVVDDWQGQGETREKKPNDDANH